MNVGAVVMASGQSERFGAEDKLLAVFRGKPLVCHTLDALAAADGLHRRLVVTRSEAVAALARARGFEVALHALPDVSDTIRLGARALCDMDGLMYCVADQPFLTGDTVRALVAAFGRDTQSVVRAGYGGRVGNPVLFPKRLFGALMALGEGQTGGAVLRADGLAVTVAQAGSALELCDIDTREDFLRYAKGG